METIVTPAKSFAEMKNFVDLSDGSRITAFLDETGKPVKIAGVALIGVRTAQGTGVLPIEFEFPEEVDTIEKAKTSYQEYANKAIENKKAELENRNRIITPAEAVGGREPLVFPGLGN